MISRACPVGQRLHALLEEDGASDVEELAHHLENCRDCQETLLDLAAPADVWCCTVRGLRNEARTEPTLRHLVERLKEEAPLPAEDFGLSFLKPADKPGVLGLLDRYEVQEEIGRGGMGVVLKALDPSLNRIVAIKVLSPALASSATARRRFVREGKAAAAVCHDHLVTVHGVDATEGLPYLVMQYVAGESLQVRLDRTGSLAIEEIVRIGLQTASGLAAAHAQGLIHRDIKPANLLLENDLSRVKITDFGLARMSDDVALTQNGVVAGTPEYMAPEQTRAEVVDHRADLFSLGSVLYACCAGKPPFRGATVLAVLSCVNDKEPTPIRSLNPDVPAWLEAFIARLMAKDADQRFASAAEAAALLEGFLAHLARPGTVAAPELPSLCGGHPLKPPGSSARQVSVRSFQRSVLLAPLLLVAALGMGAFLWLAGAIFPLAGSEQYEQSFRGGPDGPPDWERFGPDAEERVQFEPNGLRITLSPGSSKTTGTGVRSTFGVKGDFEITVIFEILQESAPAVPNKRARFTLAVLLDRPGFNMAAISRAVNQKGAIKAPSRPSSEFQTWTTLWNESSGNNKDRFHVFPTEAKTGRLRLVRTGSALSFYTSENRQGDFVLLKEYLFGGEDLKDIRLVAALEDSRQVSLDVRVSDLRIRATNVALDAASADGLKRPSGSRKWLSALGIMSLMVFAALGVILVARRRRSRNSRLVPSVKEEAPAKPALPSISLLCSRCAKTLKVKAEFAGKKIKCPQCGQTSVVPSLKTTSSGGAS